MFQDNSSFFIAEFVNVALRKSPKLPPNIFEVLENLTGPNFVQLNFQKLVQNQMSKRSFANDLKELDQAVTRAKKTGNQISLISALLNRAEFYFEHSNFDDSLKNFEDALDKCRSVRCIESQLWALRRMTDIYIAVEKFEDAKNFSDKYLEAAKTFPGSQGKIELQQAYFQCGRAYSMFGENTTKSEIRSYNRTAEKMFYESEKILLALKHQSDNNQAKANLYQNMAQFFSSQKIFSKAEKYADLGIEAAKTENNKETLLMLYDAKVDIFANNKMFEKAISLLKLQLKISTEMKDKLSKFRYLASLARYHCKLGDVEQALSSLKRALLLRNAAPDEELDVVEGKAKYLKRIQMLHAKTEVYCNLEDMEKLADKFSKLKVYSKAVELYIRVADGLEKVNRKDNHLPDVYMSICDTYRDLGQFQASIDYYKLYFDKVNTLDTRNLAKKCEIQRHLSRALYLSADEDAAIEQLQYAQELAGKSQDETQIQLCSDLLLKMNEEDSDAGEWTDVDNESATSFSSIDNVDLSSCSEDEDEKRLRIEKLHKERRKRNEKGETRLQAAVIAGKIREVQEMIRAKHSVNVQDEMGWTPLHEAANRNYPEICELLIRNGAVVDARCGTSSMTPLVDAAKSECLESVKVLLQFKANPYIIHEGTCAALIIQEFYQKNRAFLADEQISLLEEIFSLIKLFPKPKNLSSMLAPKSKRKYDKLLLSDSEDQCPSVVRDTPIETNIVYQVEQAPKPRDLERKGGAVKEYEEALAAVSGGRLYHKKPGVAGAGARVGPSVDSDSELDSDKDPIIDLDDLSENELRNNDLPVTKTSRDLPSDTEISPLKTKARKPEKTHSIPHKKNSVKRKSESFSRARYVSSSDEEESLPKPLLPPKKRGLVSRSPAKKKNVIANSPPKKKSNVATSTPSGKKGCTISSCLSQAIPDMSTILECSSVSSTQKENVNPVSESSKSVSGVQPKILTNKVLSPKITNSSNQSEVSTCAAIPELPTTSCDELPFRKRFEDTNLPCEKPVPRTEESDSSSECEFDNDQMVNDCPSPEIGRPEFICLANP